MRGYGQFDEEIFEHEKLNSREEYQKWKQDTKEKLSKLNELVGEEYKIPPITHAVYFTSNEEPKPMKPLYLSKYINTSTRLSLEDQNFKHIIWTNNPEVIAAEVKNLPGVEVRLCEEFKEHPLYANLIALLEQSQLDSRKFVEASDVARVIAIQKHGGIYHDLDYEVYDAKAMISFMKAFEHFNAKEAESWDSSIGNAFIANAPYHPVINKTAEILKRNLNQDENTPDYVKYPKNKFDGVIAQTGPVAITMANYLVGSKGGIIFPDKIIYNADYARNPSSGDIPKSNFEGIEIKTVGGDMFSGSWGTSDYLQDIYYDYVPGRPMDTREMRTKFNKAIKNNQLDKVDQLLLHQNDRWILTEALLTSINSKNIQMFNKILDKFDGNLSDPLRATVKENNLETLNILLARIVDEEVLYEGMGVAIDNGNQEIFKIILEKISKSSLLNKAFNRAIDKDQLIIFKELLTKISDESTLNQALWETASKNKKAMFESILPMVNDQNAIASAFKAMIDSYHNNEEMLDSFLLTLEQPVIGQALCDMVNNYNRKFDQMLAKVTDQEWLGKALKLTLDDNYSYEKFDKILSKVTDQKVLNELLKLTAGQYYPVKFYKILPKVTCQETLKEALAIAAEYDRGNKVMQLLKMLPDISQEQMFDQALTESHISVVEELLPQIPDQNRLEQALSLAIKNKNAAIINSLIDRVDKAELFDNLLVNSLKSSYGQLDKSFKYKIDHEEMFFKLLAKNNNQKELGEALSYSMEKHQHHMSKAIIDKITDQEILNTAFTNFILKATELSWTNFQLTEDQKELCNKFLPKVTDQKALTHAFSYINDQEILDVLFSKITDQNQIDLGKALSFVSYNEDKFNKLLLKLPDQSALVEVLSNLLNNKWKDHLINRVLLKITEEKYFAEIVKKSIEHNREDLAETYLEKITEQKSLDEIFTCAVNKNNNHFTDKILLKITEEKYFAGIVKKAIEHDKKELAEKYLEKVNEQKSLDEIFSCAVKKNNQEIITKLLPSIIDKEVLKEALNYTIKEEQQDITDSILATITDQELLKHAIEKAIQHYAVKMFKELLPKVTNHQFVIETLNQHKITLEQDFELSRQEEDWTKIYETYKNLEKVKIMVAVADFDQNTLDNIFIKASEKNTQEIFFILLPTIESQEVLGNALEKSMKLSSLDIFKMLLPKITDQSIVERVFIDPLKLKNKFLEVKELIQSKIDDIGHNQELEIFQEATISMPLVELDNKDDSIEFSNVDFSGLLLGDLGDTV